MKHSSTRHLAALALLIGSGVLISAQGIQLPSAPPKQFGASVTPAFEGWFNNADGTHSLLVGYYNRNTNLEVDIPLGPNNHFEPDRKSTRLNSSHHRLSRMPSSA